MRKKTAPDTAQAATLPLSSLIASIEHQVGQMRDANLTRVEHRGLLNDRGRSQSAAAWRPIVTGTRASGQQYQ